MFTSCSPNALFIYTPTSNVADANGEAKYMNILLEVANHKIRAVQGAREAEEGGLIFIKKGAERKGES